ncbi:hypothetical protein [Micromonospora sp. WMMD736]|uniref:hypothetical protein n=1 Tax=Micromonospora sp. WMMD736 TaxID=3404112 RepID=UPI003B94A1C1
MLRQITEAAQAGRCEDVESMASAVATLERFLRRSGAVLTLDQDADCPCCDPRQAMDTRHRIARAVPIAGRREVQAIMGPLAERHRARTLHDPSRPQDSPWWWRRIADR